MPELSAGHVRELAAALGLPMTDEDVAEVAHRLNGFLQALAPLAELPLDAEEPVPVWPEPSPESSPEPAPERRPEPRA